MPFPFTREFFLMEADKSMNSCFFDNKNAEKYFTVNCCVQVNLMIFNSKFSVRPIPALMTDPPKHTVGYCDILVSVYSRFIN